MSFLRRFFKTDQSRSVASKRSSDFISDAGILPEVSKSFLKAARWDKWGEVKGMLKNGPSLARYTDESGWTALHYAAMKGEMEAVEALIANGADSNARTNQGTTPLHLAMGSGRDQVEQFLLLHRADRSAKDADGNKPIDLKLIRSVSWRRVDEVDRLLKENANVSAREDFRGDKSPVIFFALCNSDSKQDEIDGSLKILEMLLDAGANIDARGPGGFTPLMCAIEFRRAETVEFLLNRGASTAVRASNGRDAIKVSLAMTRESSNPVYREILRTMVSRTDEGKTWALSLEGKAWLRDHSEVPTAPLGTSPAEAWSTFQSALMPSSPQNQDEAIMRWIESGGNIGWTCAEGMTLLHYAAMMDNERMARFLLGRGARVDARSKYNMTALHFACRHRGVSVIPILLEHGADASAEADEGLTALQYIRQHGYEEIQKLLIDHGAKQTPAKDTTCQECGAPEVEKMGKRGVLTTLIGGKIALIASFPCTGCKTQQEVPLRLIDKAAGTQVACRSCNAVSFVPPSVWCSTCSGGLSSDWQSLISRQ